jgi:hypothetical protein
LFRKTTRIISLQGIPESHPNQSPEEIEQANAIADGNARILGQLPYPPENWVVRDRGIRRLLPNEVHPGWSTEGKALLDSATVALGWWSCLLYRIANISRWRGRLDYVL